MNKTQLEILDHLKEHLFYTAILALTLFFFFFKGLVYLMIGSFIPIILISVIVILFVISSHKSKKSFKRVIGFWAVLLILWSSVRILLSLTNQFVKQIPESHVSEQLGIFGFILSLLFFSGAIYLWRFKKRIF